MERNFMPSGAAQTQAASRLAENGPGELEALLRATVYHPSAAILIEDKNRHCRDASSGAAKLLGPSRDEIIGRSLDDFVEPGFKRQISVVWKAFLQREEQEGTLRLVGPGGGPRQVEYTAKGNVLPGRHLLVLRDKTVQAESEARAEGARSGPPAWVQDLQSKLLRAWQEKAFESLGGAKKIPIDVRLVVATNRNLTRMMGSKLFRTDLYYRLRGFPITTPSLRNNSKDIPLLARHFTKKWALKMNKQIETIPSDTMRALESWTWSANVRELETYIERAVILSGGPKLRAPLGELRADALETAGSGLGKGLSYA